MRCKNGPREVKWAVVNCSKSLSPLKEWNVTYLVGLEGYCLIKSSCWKIRHWIQKILFPNGTMKCRNEKNHAELTNRKDVPFHQVNSRSHKFFLMQQIWYSFVGMSYFTSRTQSNLHLQITIYFDTYNILLMGRH